MDGRLALMALLMAALPSCSSSDDSGPPTREGDIRANEVWKNGLKLTGVVRIFEGATVEIEPGARITCVNPALIVVGGTLRVASTGKHATIACSHWGGLKVAG